MMPSAGLPPLDVSRLARAVTEGLLPIVRIAGEDVRRPMSQRLSDYGCPGLAVAVLDDGQVEGARVLERRPHEMTRDQRRLGEMDRQLEALEVAKNLQGFLHAPVALVHVRLDPDHINFDPRFQAALDQNIVRVRDVEVIEQ